MAESSSEKAAAALDKEMREVMPLAHPVETATPDGTPPEPDKPVPDKGDDGADTPSGHALMLVGPPDPDDAGSDAEGRKGMKYKLEKFKKRWLG